MNADKSINEAGCGECNKSMVNETKKVVCWGCDRPFHQTTSCSGIPKGALSYVLGQAMWFCKGCEIPCSRMFKGLCDVQTRLESAEQAISSNAERIKILEETPNPFHETITELRLREDKKYNVMIKGCVEATGLTNEERKNHDQNAILDIIRATGVDICEKDCRVVYRMGRKENEVTKGRPRMILVGLREATMRDKILECATNLRKSEIYHKIYIDPDLTKAQILDDEEMRKEAKRRSDSGNGSWRVVGRKGSGKLVRMKN